MIFTQAPLKPGEVRCRYCASSGKSVSLRLDETPPKETYVHQDYLSHLYYDAFDV